MKILENSQSGSIYNYENIAIIIIRLVDLGLFGRSFGYLHFAYADAS